MPAIRGKTSGLRSVKEAAIERISYLFSAFDSVSISFSGGKDSTACLHLALDEAKRRNKLPLRLIFFDEEAIHPPTVEYVERVRQWPGVALEWYCLPVKHRNACSNTQPFWQCWNPAEKHLWVRPMPEWAITSHPQFTPGMTIPEFRPQMMHRNECCIQGIRTQESVRRYRMIASKLNDHFIARKGGKAFAYPIYDWGSADVWRLVRDEGYDYNRTYDVMNRTQLFNDLLHQRVCPPFGEEPLRGLWKYAECWPELWHKMLYRVPGAATAWRYANTELYTSNAKPDGMTWEQYTELQLANYSEPEIQAGVRTRVKATIAEHRMKTNDPIPEVASHPLSGCSWKFLSKIAVKGDFKNRTRLGMNLRGQVERKKTGMTYEEALKKFGTPGFQAAEKVKSDRPGIMAAR